MPDGINLLRLVHTGTEQDSIANALPAVHVTRNIFFQVHGHSSSLKERILVYLLSWRVEGHIREACRAVACLGHEAGKDAL